LIDFPLISAEAAIHTCNADIRTHFSFGRGGAPAPGSEDRLRSFAQTSVNGAPWTRVAREAALTRQLWRLRDDAELL
jgi:hypothetical protein